MRKFILFLSMCLILIVSCFVSASAETYSTEYPSVGNSGSPLWIHCEVEGRGDYLVIIDPNTNIQAFGFDTPRNGYNLINNTASTITGRAYSTSGNGACSVRFPSFYCMTMRLGYDSNGNQTQYVDAKITKIYGTTFDLIDYTGTRGNDNFKHDIPQREFFIIVSVLLFIVVLLFVISIVFKPKLFRM